MTTNSIKSTRFVSLDEAAQEMTVVRPQKTYLRSTFLDRQKREKDLLDSLYQEMPVGIEQRFMRASRVAEHLGLATSFVDSSARTFEQLGILTRRLEFSAKDDSGKAISGRSYHWTLLLYKLDALARLDRFHTEERSQTDKAPRTKTISLKARILAALSTVDKFDTMQDLLRAVRRNDENLDFHNMKHVMESLVREGKITFDRGTTKEKIPFNIHLTKVGAKSTQTLASVCPACLEPVGTRKNPTHAKNGGYTCQVQPEPVSEPKKTVDFVDAHEFPTIAKLVNRREWLEAASKLAESAEEEDLAISLMERANKPFSALEQEAITLYEAYKECKDG